MLNNYQIYIDNHTGEDLIPLFIPQNDEYSLYDIVYKPVAGSAGSLTFKMPISNPSRSKIEPLTTDFWLFKNKVKIFRGRYVGNTEDMYKTGNVTLEGDLNYLVDSIQEPYNHQGTIIQFLTMILNKHNAQVETRKQFKLGNVTVVDSNNYINRSNENYSTTAEVLKEKLVDTHSGLFRVRYESDGNYLDYVTDYGGINSQTVRFGENLIDISKKIDASNIITCLYPIGSSIEVTQYSNEETYLARQRVEYNEKTYECKANISTPEDWNESHWKLLGEDLQGIASKLDISSVNNGLKYIVNQDGVNKWGKIWGTYEWENVTEPANLLTKARAYLEEQIALPTSLELTAFDLSLIDLNVQDFKIGYWTNVVSGPHELSGTYLLRSAEINISDPSKSKITLGDETKNMSSTVARTKVEASQKVSELAASTAMWVNEAIDNATTLIRGGLGGYIVMPKNSKSGYPEEILIMDSPDISKAKNVIRLNRNGIGFSTSGYNGVYRNAWTIDGNLVADFITTGTLTAITIQNAPSGNRIMIDKTSSLKGMRDNDLINVINMCQYNNTDQMTIDAKNQLNIRTPRLVIEDQSHGQGTSNGYVALNGSYNLASVIGKYYENDSGPEGGYPGAPPKEYFIALTDENKNNVIGAVYATLPVYLKMQTTGMKFVNGIMTGGETGAIYAI